MMNTLLSQPPQILFLEALIVVASFLYTYTTLILISSILIRSKLTVITRCLVSLFNSFLMLAMIFIPQNTSAISYIVAFFVLLCEFHFLHNDRMLRSVFVTLACTTHLMGLRSIFVAIVSYITGYTFYEVANKTSLLLLSTIISFFVLDFIIFLVIKLIPAEKIRIINQHTEQLWFMVSWLAIFNIYLLINSIVYNVNSNYVILNILQIFTPVCILLGTYIILFFAMKTSTLLGYKEKNFELEHEIHKEQQYRNSITNDSIATYEFNLTTNKFVTGFDEYKKLIAYNDDMSYDDLIITAGKSFVYEKDIAEFEKFSSSANLLDLFAQSKSEIPFDYRRIMPDGSLIWARSITNIVKDNISGDIRGFTYVKNIDKEKKSQIELQFKAERDLLTGLYNKGTTGKLIDEYVNSCVDSNVGGALFIMDVDSFKDINDSLGHTFGDAVLCELGEKLTELFRDSDIVGRIGGDEFIAFMKNTSNLSVIEAKAKEIRKNFHSFYQGEGKMKYEISSSIGISVFPQYGNTFDALYRNADIALYASKNKGKNTYTIYDGEEFQGYRPDRTDIDSMSFLGQKSFKDNRVEYVFKILYGSATPVSAIHSVLELLAEHFKFSRGYIFENTEDGLFTSNTFEWCANNIEPQIATLQNIPIELVKEAFSAFHISKSFIMKNINQLDSNNREILIRQGIKSMLQFGIFEQEKLVGFIGFDDCENERNPSKEQVEEISTICNVLATFIVKQRAIQKSESNSSFLDAIMDNWDSYAYIIDKQTFKFLFVNDQIKKIVGNIHDNNYCYKSIMGNDEPCVSCPVRHLSDDFPSKYSMEIYNEKLGIWIEGTASNIVWQNESHACLVNCIDISKYRQ